MATFTHLPGETAHDAFFPVTESELKIATADGVDLPATLFTGEGDGPAVLVSSAAAVERRFYRAFATNLVENGARAVLTYDYRGVGAAAKATRAKDFRMKDWGVRDFPAALAALKAAAGPGPLAGIGHSFGGVALGLSGEAEAFERYCLVASLNGYYGRTAEPAAVFSRMNLAGVPATYLFGHVPAAVGLGTALAGPIFRDWARWCRRPDFFFSDPTVPEAARFADVAIPLRSIGFTDDRWGTPAAVAALLGKFSNAAVEELWLGPDDAGDAIGHMGFFRRAMREPLWPAATAFLLDGRRRN
ncbi:alpha/beta fold hydrolase [Jiella sp. MQZ13P-4]|uniref:Alpha/beta fold hydrolase n=2 Tax=Jiella sonneratiae TaxID=2816856 RepID=A0ABS3JC04_9HYPH|nr:alpha/beta fold hydrolase [Jiella sonneratiae]MBO0906488.1 alpha/beta fold hydrolase [Jiella sonneratiae]